MRRVHATRASHPRYGDVASPPHADSEWQGGNAAFSVSQSNLEQVKQYIAGQEEHHHKIGFQDELRALLKRHEIEWDEKYVWD